MTFTARDVTAWANAHGEHVHGPYPSPDQWRRFFDHMARTAPGDGPHSSQQGDCS